MKKSFAMFLALIILLLSGCNSASTTSPENFTAAKGEQYSQYYGSDSSDLDLAYSKGSSNKGKTVYVTNTETAFEIEKEGQQKIIHNASLKIETTKFDEAVKAINSLVQKYKGYFTNSNISGNTHYNDDGAAEVINRVGDFEIRIPAPQYSAFFDESGSIGNITSSSKNASDITASYVDNEARLKSLRIQENRLLELVTKAENIDTLITLEERLSDVRYEIESIEAQLRTWDKLVEYSTVKINLLEVENYTPTAAASRSFGTKIVDAFKNGLKSFVNGAENLAEGIVYVLPFIIIWAFLLGLGAVFTIRAIKKNKKKKIAATPPTNP